METLVVYLYLYSCSPRLMTRNELPCGYNAGVESFVAFYYLFSECKLINIVISIHRHYIFSSIE